MTEEKKAKVKKIILAIEILFAVILTGYIVLGIVTKETNQTVFNILAVGFVVSFFLLNDVAEPYFTKVFENMDDFRKEAYKKYLFWDLSAMAGLLLFVFNVTNTESSTMFIAGAFLYFIGSKNKRNYQDAYLGRVTKEDVEAAKAAVADVEAIEVDAVEVEDAVEETEESVEE